MPLMLETPRPQTLAIHTTDLPPALREIADAVGLEAALRLIECWGGVRIYLPGPDRLTDDHILARGLGRPAAEQLCRHFGAGAYTVPRGLEALRAARDRAMRAEHADGRSARDLALAYRLSERRVWEILARDERPAEGSRVLAVARGQMALF